MLPGGAVILTDPLKAGPLAENVTDCASIEPLAGTLELPSKLTVSTLVGTCAGSQLFGSLVEPETAPVQVIYAIA
jgi:hypothetical protein